MCGEPDEPTRTTRIYIGNLPHGFTVTELLEKLSLFPGCDVIVRRDSMWFNGSFAIISVPSAEIGEFIKSHWNGQMWGEHEIKVMDTLPPRSRVNRPPLGRGRGRRCNMNGRLPSSSTANNVETDEPKTSPSRPERRPHRSVPFFQRIYESRVKRLRERQGQLRVRLLNPSRIFEVDVDPTDKVHILKSKVYDLLCESQDSFGLKLVFKGLVLDDDQDLSHYNMTSATPIIAVKTSSFTNTRPNSQMSSSIVLGIDLGTTNSCAAVYRQKREPEGSLTSHITEVLTDFDSAEILVPSIVSFASQPCSIGVDARDTMKKHPDKTFF
ncbi:hypothetical protein GEMRC1_006220 [Eukaryota sp. GEM-RC1]